jgi:hypothetical protein
MAIKYTLSIGNVTKKFTVGEFNNVIVDVSVGVSASSDAVVEIVGTDEDGNNIYSTTVPPFSYSCGGTISLDTSELDTESFVDFDSVTKETVIGWLLAKEGVETVEEFSYVKSSIDNIQARIDELQEQESVSTGWSVSNIPEQDQIGQLPEDPAVLEA